MSGEKRLEKGETEPEKKCQIKLLGKQLTKGTRKKWESEQEANCQRKQPEKQRKQGTREKERGSIAGMLVSDNPNVISE